MFDNLVSNFSPLSQFESIEYLDLGKNKLANLDLLPKFDQLQCLLIHENPLDNL